MRVRGRVTGRTSIQKKKEVQRGAVCVSSAAGSWELQEKCWNTASVNMDGISLPLEQAWVSYLGAASMEWSMEITVQYWFQ